MSLFLGILIHQNKKKNRESLIMKMKYQIVICQSMGSPSKKRHFGIELLIIILITVNERSFKEFK